jgi:prophage regulatory protein
MNNCEELLMKILRLKAVMERTGLGRSSIYKFIAAGTFPKPISLGERAKGFVEAEVEEWIKARVMARDA